MDIHSLQFGTIYIVGKNPVSPADVEKLKHAVDRAMRMDLVLSQAATANSLPPSFLWETIIDPSVKDTLLVTRLVNVGNLGRDAVVKVPLRGFNSNTIYRFVDVALDVASEHIGDIEITVRPKPCSSGRGILADSFLVRASEEMHVPDTSGAMSCSEPFAEYVDSDLLDINLAEEPGIAFKTVADEDASELAQIQQAQSDAFRRLRMEVIKYVLTYHADPRLLMQHLLEGKFVVNANGLSPLVVNGDTEIVLSGYDEVNVKMPAMCRAIYILFLCHHERGIVLKEISDYQSELEDIYSVVKPGRDTERRKAIIEAVCDPLSNRLNECLSRIKKCFTIVMGNTSLVDNYCITGNPGQPYRINLPSEMITIPSVFTKNEG